MALASKNDVIADPLCLSIISHLQNLQTYSDLSTLEPDLCTLAPLIKLLEQHPESVPTTQIIAFLQQFTDSEIPTSSTTLTLALEAVVEISLAYLQFNRLHRQPKLSLPDQDTLCTALKTLSEWEQDLTGSHILSVATILKVRYQVTVDIEKTWTSAKENFESTKQTAVHKLLFDALSDLLSGNPSNTHWGRQFSSLHFVPDEELTGTDKNYLQALLTIVSPNTTPEVTTSRQWLQLLAVGEGLQIHSGLLQCLIPDGPSQNLLDSEITKLSRPLNTAYSNFLTTIRSRMQIDDPITRARWEMAEKRIGAQVVHIRQTPTLTPEQEKGILTLIKEWQSSLDNTCSTGTDLQLLTMGDYLQSILGRQNLHTELKSDVRKWIINQTMSALQAIGIPQEYIEDVHHINHALFLTLPTQKKSTTYPTDIFQAAYKEHLDSNKQTLARIINRPDLMLESLFSSPSFAKKSINTALIHLSESGVLLRRPATTLNRTQTESLLHQLLKLQTDYITPDLHKPLADTLDRLVRDTDSPYALSQDPQIIEGIFRLLNTADTPVKRTLLSVIEQLSKSRINHAILSQDTTIFPTLLLLLNTSEGEHQEFIAKTLINIFKEDPQLELTSVISGLSAVLQLQNTKIQIAALKVVTSFTINTANLSELGQNMAFISSIGQFLHLSHKTLPGQALTILWNLATWKENIPIFQRNPMLISGVVAALQHSHQDTHTLASNFFYVLIFTNTLTKEFVENETTTLGLITALQLSTTTTTRTKFIAAIDRVIYETKNKTPFCSNAQLMSALTSKIPIATSLEWHTLTSIFSILANSIEANLSPGTHDTFISGLALLLKSEIGQPYTAANTLMRLATHAHNRTALGQHVELINTLGDKMSSVSPTTQDIAINILVILSIPANNKALFRQNKQLMGRLTAKTNDTPATKMKIQGLLKKISEAQANTAYTASA